jgi:beta-lactamase regulating signal transducer with metallopeptidase domain
MNRARLFVAGVLWASSPLLVDSALKGTALLVVAAIAAVILRRDSAATRHLVWLLAIVAMLVVPALSAMLPQWRVLPQWAGFSPDRVAVETNPPVAARPADPVAQFPRNAEPVDVERPTATASRPAAEIPASPPALPAPEIRPKSSAGSGNWINALPFVWAIGFCVLILRLLAARVTLWNLKRQGTVIWSSRQAGEATHDPIVTAHLAMSSQLGIFRPVTLLIHPGETIPVVWGILGPRLLLPAAARQWSGEQLRSVLLHELAHIKRRDTTAQLLVQLACALHWFNPLVWFAAWRLGVERERACDDLVLAGGVRPSAYAAHLLELVAGLSPGRWKPSCGLAMARKSSLEGRLVAVLSQNLNRRGVSVALAAIALVIAAGIAVPVAMLRAADEKPVAPVQNDPQKPENGAKLNPGMEEKLQWGEPVNGLRMAMIRPPAFGEPDAGEHIDLKLVVQNVSEAPIRFSTASAAPGSPHLSVRENGEILFAIHDSKPIRADFMLEPRQVSVMRLFSDRSEGRSITSDIPVLTYSVAVKVEKAPAGTWTGKLVTAETHALFTAYGLMPKHKDAQAIFRVWNAGARLNGKIPGAFIGLLADSVTTFMKNNATRESTPQLLKMRSRLDATRDWSGLDALALLDDLAAVEDSPIKMVLDKEMERTIHEGMPLPPELAAAPWGKALPNGLRMAWLLEPRAAAYRLGTPLECRILIHNAGNNLVVFRTRTSHQGNHKATDAKGAVIGVQSVPWTTTGRLVPFQLAPGEFVEVSGTGIAIGANKNAEDWQNTRVGSWVEAKEGDEVTVTTAPVPLCDWNENPQPGGESRWWLDFIAMRLSRRLPLPADADERARLLDRMAVEFFRTPVGEEEFAAFVPDRDPAPLDSLSHRLAKRTDLVTPFTGSLQSAPTTFRVLPADPDAAKRPRTASNPGRYALGENAVLVVTRRPAGERIVNEASIQFIPPDPAKPAPGEPHELKLPDGYGTWAAAWVRGGTLLWLLEKNGVRRFDFSTPANVKEASTEPGKVPVEIREALRGALSVPVPESAPKRGANGASPPASSGP